MFQELQPLLATVASMTISMVENTDGTITLTVIPVGVKKGSKLDSQMQLVGTAAELDEGFAAHLNSYNDASIPGRPTGRHRSDSGGAKEGGHRKSEEDDCEIFEAGIWKRSGF